MQGIKALCCVIFVIILLSMTMVSAQTPDQNNITLNEKLKLLEPMVNKKWVGIMQTQNDDKGLEIVRQFDVILNGNVIKYNSYCRELNFESEGYIYWDFNENKISLFFVTSRGTFQDGFITDDSGKIVFSGSATFPTERLEYKNIFEFSEDGKLSDRWFSFEQGAWKPGHDMVLTAEEE